MRNLSLFAPAFFSFALNAQTFEIGHTTRSWFDPDRSRTVTAEVYYPAQTAGDDMAAADGTFPVLVIGHGFVMTVNAYNYLWTHFVPQGYIAVLPTTEGGFLPDHADFAQDIAFCLTSLQAEGADNSSLLFEHVNTDAAFMGHSMGGGAALLASSGNTSIRTMVLLAPAETDPSAIAAAPAVTVPALLFAGSEDCVTPIADHQQPMYDALDVPCKALVTVLGGGHCYFGDANFNCTFGEFTCGPDLTISREQQQAVVTDLAGLWLDRYVRANEDAAVPLLDSLSNSTRISGQNTCLSTVVAIKETEDQVQLWPQPASDRVQITGIDVNAPITITTAAGSICGTWQGNALDVSQLPTGIYVLFSRAKGLPVQRRMLVSH